MPVLKLEKGFVAQRQELLQQPPAQREDQAQGQVPADDEMLAPLDREFDIGQRGGDQGNE